MSDGIWHWYYNRVEKAVFLLPSNNYVMMVGVGQKTTIIQ